MVNLKQPTSDQFLFFLSHWRLFLLEKRLRKPHLPLCVVVMLFFVVPNSNRLTERSSDDQRGSGLTPDPVIHTFKCL